MLNEHAKAWVAALRSGEYSQAQGMLHNHHGYCCLGVACDLYHQDTGNGNGNWHHNPSNGEEYTFVDGDAVDTDALPRKVADWLGLNVELDSLVHLPSGDGLAHMNDCGDTFEQIADVIVAHEAELFIA